MARLGPWASPLPARRTSLPPLQLREGGPAQLGAPSLHLQVRAHRKFSLCPGAGVLAPVLSSRGHTCVFPEYTCCWAACTSCWVLPAKPAAPSLPRLRLRRWVFFPPLHCCQQVGVLRGQSPSIIVTGLWAS